MRRVLAGVCGLLCFVFLLGCDPAKIGANLPGPGDKEAEAGARLVQQRKFAEAVPHLKSALDKPLRVNRKSNVLTILGTCYSELERWDEALKMQEEALREEPNSHQIMVNTGILCRRMGQYEKAKECYYKALAIAPDYVEAHASLGALLMLEKQYEKAIEHLQKAVALDDSSVISHANLSMTYASVGRIKEAEAELEKASSLGYHNVEVVRQYIKKMAN